MKRRAADAVNEKAAASGALSGMPAGMTYPSTVSVPPGAALSMQAGGPTGSDYQPQTQGGGSRQQLVAAAPPQIQYIPMPVPAPQPEGLLAKVNSILAPISLLAGTGAWWWWLGWRLEWRRKKKERVGGGPTHHPILESS